MLDCEAPASALVEADVEVLVIEASRLREWLRSQDHVRDYVLRSMADRIIDLMNLSAEVTFGRMRDRLRTFLVSRFKPRVGFAMRELRITHEEVASAVAVEAAALKRENEQLSRDLSESELRHDTTIENLRNIIEAAKSLYKKRSGPRTVLNLTIKGLSKIIKDYEAREEQKSKEAKGQA